MTILGEDCPVGGLHSIDRDDEWDDRVRCWKCGAWWEVSTLPVAVLEDLD